MLRTLQRVVLLGLVAAALLSAGQRVRLGGIQISGGYTHFSGPAWFGPGWGWGPGGWGGPLWGAPMWGPAWRWAMWDPFWFGGPLMHPGYYNGFLQGPGMGEVKLSSPSKEAMVFVDGAYAGDARKLKSIWLEPGVYTIEVRDENAGSFERKVYVLSGKTLDLRAQLSPKKEDDDK